MEGGDLFTLLFWGVIILLSILQSAVQSKQKKKPPGPRPPDEDMEAGWEDATLFDDDTAAVGDEKAASMIPEDVWDEIAGLARDEEATTGTYGSRGPERRELPEGRAQPVPAPPVEPREDPHRPPYRSRAEIQAERRKKERQRIRRERDEVVQERAAESVARERTPARGLSTAGPSGTGAEGSLPAVRPEHPVHLSHAGYGTDPSSRAESVPRVSVPESSGDAAAARTMLRAGGSSLRQAFILREVLGPPKGLE